MNLEHIKSKVALSGKESQVMSQQASANFVDLLKESLHINAQLVHENHQAPTSGRSNQISATNAQLPSHNLTSADITTTMTEVRLTPVNPMAMASKPPLVEIGLIKAFGLRVISH
jgi:hypothetical protein